MITSSIVSTKGQVLKITNHSLNFILQTVNKVYIVWNFKAAMFIFIYYRQQIKKTHSRAASAANWSLPEEKTH